MNRAFLARTPASLPGTRLPGVYVPTLHSQPASPCGGLDAFYFCAITLTTVGYGDLSPQTAAGRLFTVFYLFTGIGLIVAFLNAVARTAIEQRNEGRGPPGRRKRPPEDRQHPQRATHGDPVRQASLPGI